MTATTYAESYAEMTATIAGNIREGIRHHPIVCRQDILAVSVDVSPHELSQRMTGKVPWELELLFDVARVLDVAASDLFRGPDDE